MIYENESPDTPDEKVPDGFEDFFATLTAEMGKPSVSEQTERLKILTDRFYREWSLSGLLTKLYDATPLDLIDGEMSLRRVTLRNADGLDVTEMYVQVQKNVQVSEDSNRSNREGIPIAQSLGGLVMPVVGGRFDEADAALVFQQAAEIDALKTSGFLPDVADNLLSIKDLSRSITGRKSTGEV